MKSQIKRLENRLDEIHGFDNVYYLKNYLKVEREDRETVTMMIQADRNDGDRKQ